MNLSYECYLALFSVHRFNLRKKTRKTDKRTLDWIEWKPHHWAPFLRIDFINRIQLCILSGVIVVGAEKLIRSAILGRLPGSNGRTSMPRLPVSVLLFSHCASPALSVNWAKRSYYYQRCIGTGTIIIGTTTITITIPNTTAAAPFAKPSICMFAFIIIFDKRRCLCCPSLLSFSFFSWCTNRLHSPPSTAWLSHWQCLCQSLFLSMYHLTFTWSSVNTSLLLYCLPFWTHTQTHRDSSYNLASQLKLYGRLAAVPHPTLQQQQQFAFLLSLF